MCTFCKTSELPSHNKNNNNGKNSFISFFLKPNKENEKYRLRLLFFRNENKNDRKDAHIIQKIHEHWGASPKGGKIIDDYVVCPGTSYVHYNDDKFVLNPHTNKQELNCPICRKSRENFLLYNNSGKTDKLSSQKAYQLKAKERLCAPVYVINDPNNNKNNGQLKVLVLTNPDDIKLYQKTVDEEKTKAYLASKNGNGYEVFNNNAVDLYIQVGVIPEVKGKGTSGEYVSNVRKITKMAFGKTVQNIPDINKDAIDCFQFDDQFYFSNTKEELENFYAKYYGHGDIAEDEDVFGSDTSNTEEIQETKNEVIENTNTVNNVEISEDDLDEITDAKSEVQDDITKDKNETYSQSVTQTEEDLDKLLDEIL